MRGHVPSHRSHMNRVNQFVGSRCANSHGIDNRIEWINHGVSSQGIKTRERKKNRRRKTQTRRIRKRGCGYRVVDIDCWRATTISGVGHRQRAIEWKGRKFPKIDNPPRVCTRVYTRALSCLVHQRDWCAFETSSLRMDSPPWNLQCRRDRRSRVARSYTSSSCKCTGCEGVCVSRLRSWRIRGIFLVIQDREGFGSRDYRRSARTCEYR